MEIMRILVTGNLGFVGTETCKMLEALGQKVIGYDIMDGYDIRDIDELDYVVTHADIDRILHLAAIARFDESENNPVLAHETNVLGTMNVVSVASEYNIPLVHASTGSTYMPIKQSPPITEDFPIRGNSVYGCTKTIGEMYVAKHTPHIILRYSHLYGTEKRHNGLIGNFISRIEKGMNPELYGGKQSNDFCYIKDVAQANVKALSAPWDKWNKVYNIGSGEELTSEKAGKIICEQLGYKGKINVVEKRNVDPERFVYDISKASILLGYRPMYTFKEGLIDMGVQKRCCQ